MNAWSNIKAIAKRELMGYFASHPPWDVRLDHLRRQLAR